MLSVVLLSLAASLSHGTCGPFRPSLTSGLSLVLPWPRVRGSRDYCAARRSNFGTHQQHHTPPLFTGTVRRKAAGRTSGTEHILFVRHPDRREQTARHERGRGDSDRDCRQHLRGDARDGVVRVARCRRLCAEREREGERESGRATSAAPQQQRKQVNATATTMYAVVPVKRSSRRAWIDSQWCRTCACRSGPSLRDSVRTITTRCSSYRASSSRRPTDYAHVFRDREAYGIPELLGDPQWAEHKQHALRRYYRECAALLPTAVSSDDDER